MSEAYELYQFMASFALNKGKEIDEISSQLELFPCTKIIISGMNKRENYHGWPLVWATSKVKIIRAQSLREGAGIYLIIHSSILKEKDLSSVVNNASICSGDQAKPFPKEFLTDGQFKYYDISAFDNKSDSVTLKFDKYLTENGRELSLPVARVIYVNHFRNKAALTDMALRLFARSNAVGSSYLYTYPYQEFNNEIAEYYRNLLGKGYAE